MVASAHPLGSLVGVNVLQQGGSAMDAAVAMAAVHNVVNPAMIGIGGDTFLLYYSAKERRVIGLNGSGRSAHAATIAEYRARGHESAPVNGPLAVTVPGALDGWARALASHGTMSLGDILEPAIRYAEEGVPVNLDLVDYYEHARARALADFPNFMATYFVNGRPPGLGEILVQKNLAATFRTIARDGSRALYHGVIGEKIIAALGDLRGLMTMRDLADHTSEWVEPIATEYRGLAVHEFPPNSQGIALLEQLNILEGFDLGSMARESPERIHLQVEAARLAFRDLEACVTDPQRARIPVEKMLGKTHARELREGIKPERASTGVTRGSGLGENTAYFAVVDHDGNVASFTGSLRNPFGSGVVAGDTGILLHNRGRDFSLDPANVNRLEPHKRPRHTLNPVIVTKDGRPYLAIGCVGGHQQTQALQQVLVNHLDDRLGIQEAIEAPRWALTEDGTLHVERELQSAIPGLEARGHRVVVGQTNFGGCHAVMIDPVTLALFGGSEPRLSGAAIGY